MFFTLFITMTMITTTMIPTMIPTMITMTTMITMIPTKVDLNKPYTIRATHCVAAPRRRKQNGTYGHTDHTRLDSWWGPITVGASKSTFANGGHANSGGAPSVEIALARSTLISIAIPKSGPTAVKGKTLLKDPVPGS